MMHYSAGSTGIIHRNPEIPGSYEWWYFDACPAGAGSDISLTIIAFRGMPMSPYYLEHKGALPSEYCGYSIGIYHRGNKIAGALCHISAQEWQLSENPLDIHCGGLHIQQIDSEAWNLEFSTLPDKGMSIHGKLQFKARAPLSPPYINHSANQHYHHHWSLIAPDCTVSGNIEIQEYGSPTLQYTVQARGYHDHNTGLRPLTQDYYEWYWGRIHLPDNQTLVYYYYPAGEKQQELSLAAFILPGNNSNEILNSLFAQDIQIIPHSVRLTAGGLYCAESLEIYGIFPNGEAFTAIVQHKKRIEFGPFYYRYISECQFTYQQKHHYSEQAISEYFNAARLQNPFVHMLIKTPILFAE
jgi:carotenoid 1,2-hydratase